MLYRSVFYSWVHVDPFNLKTHVFASGKYSYIISLLFYPSHPHFFFLLYFSRTLIRKYILHQLMCNKSQQNRWFITP